mgnify:CR=1 FL=1
MTGPFRVSFLLVPLAVAGLAVLLVRGRSLQILGGLALPMALLIIGGALSVNLVRQRVGAVAGSCFMKLLLLPAIGRAQDVRPIEPPMPCPGCWWPVDQVARLDGIEADIEVNDGHLRSGLDQCGADGGADQSSDIYFSPDLQTPYPTLMILLTGADREMVAPQATGQL